MRKFGMVFKDRGGALLKPSRQLPLAPRSKKSKFWLAYMASIRSGRSKRVTTCSMVRFCSRFRPSASCAICSARRGDRRGSPGPATSLRSPTDTFAIRPALRRSSRCSKTMFGLSNSTPRRRFLRSPIQMRTATRWRSSRTSPTGSSLTRWARLPSERMRRTTQSFASIANVAFAMRSRWCFPTWCRDGIGSITAADAVRSHAGVPVRKGHEPSPQETFGPAPR